METTTDMRNAGTGIASEEILQLVSFSVGEEEFALDILNVQEINRTVEVTRLPNAPGHVDGVINLRGRVIPVIDLRTRLGLARKEHDKNTRVVVVELAGRVIGFVVDAVREVLRIPRAVTEPAPSLATAAQGQYITGVGKLEDRLLILLDVEKLVQDYAAQYVEN